MSFPYCASKSMYNTSAEQKSLSREAAWKYKNGTQRVHILREKCRQRIQEVRRTRFDGNRNFTKDDGNLINKIIHEEVSDLDSNIIMEDEVINELRDEMGEWLLKQQKEEDDYYTQLDENETVCCPLCLKSCLYVCKYDPLLIKCQCGAMFRYNGKLPDLQQEVRSVVGKHEHSCDEALIFFIEQHSCGLNVMCETCNYFHSFV